MPAIYWLSPRRKPGPINTELAVTILCCCNHSGTRTTRLSARSMKGSSSSAYWRAANMGHSTSAFMGPGFRRGDNREVVVAGELAPKLAPMGVRRHDNQGRAVRFILTML